MAGVAGNLYTLSFAKQSVKGTPASVGTGYKMKLTGGDLGPNRNFLTLQETDASRQQGTTVVVGTQIVGTPEWYLRPVDFGLFSYAVMGATAVTGSGPYVHTATMANAPPYLTAWRNVGGGTIIDKYSDIRISSIELSGGAGQAIACKVNCMGLGALFGTTDDTSAVVSDAPYTYPQICWTLAGSPPATIEQFTLMVDNQADFIQADCSLGPYDVVLGRMLVSGSFTYLLQSDADYRAFHTGSPTGTAFSSVLFSEAMVLTCDDTLGNLIVATMLGAAITAYPVTPDVSGKPIRVAATFSSLPQAAVADYLKFVVTNTIATY